MVTTNVSLNVDNTWQTKQNGLRFSWYELVARLSVSEKNLSQFLFPSTSTDLWQWQMCLRDAATAAATRIQVAGAPSLHFTQRLSAL